MLKLSCFMVYAVYTTKSFDKEVEKLPKDDQKIIQKIFLKIRENPYSSDQLRYKNLREKRIREKRVYFLVYEDLELVLLVATSGKKDQQITIHYIKKHLGEFKKIAEDVSKQVS